MKLREVQTKGRCESSEGAYLEEGLQQENEESKSIEWIKFLEFIISMHDTSKE